MLDVAIDAAKQAGDLALKYFKSQPKVIYKADKSPVTSADIEAEKLIRRIISSKFPDHGIHGEELADKKAKSQFTWVIDPIDGTRDFIRGIPFWAVYVAVLKDNKPIIGVIHLPILDEMITAELGKSTKINGKKVRVSKTKTLKESYISHGQIKRFIALNKINQLENLCKKVRAARSYGNFGFKMLLEGHLDVVIEAYGGLHDFAATKIIAEEAGGRFTDFSGLDSMTSGNAIWSNGLIHEQVINVLNSNI